MQLHRVILLVGVALLPMVGAEVYDTWANRQAAEAQIGEDALRLTRFFGAEQDRITESAQQLLIALSKLESVHAKDKAACSQQFNSLARKYPNYLSLAAYDVAGEPICASIGSIANVKDQAFFRTVAKDLRFTVGNYSNERGMGAVSFANPMLNESGELTGVIEAKLSLAWLEGYFKDQVGAQHASLTIADKYGGLLVRLPRAGKIGRAVPDSYAPLLQSDKEAILRDASFDHVSRLIGVLPVGVPPAPEFFVSAGISTAEALAPADAASYRALALIGLAGASGLAIAWALGRRSIARDAEPAPAATAPVALPQGRPRIGLVKSER